VKLKIFRFWLTGQQLFGFDTRCKRKLEAGMQFGFANVPVPERPGKPRQTGVNMMIDWGLGLAAQADAIRTSGVYIDRAKIAGGIPRVMPRDILMEKLALYREQDIGTATGGLFTELTLKQGTFERMVEDAATLGFTAIEVSENLEALSAKVKSEAIASVKRAGLKAIGEVGRKEGRMSDDEVVADTQAYLEAGADAIYLEAYELFSEGEVREDLIRRLARDFPAELLFFELPVIILPGIHREFKHKITAWLRMFFWSWWP
jgi:phosphosulfolactate synthase